MLRASRAPRLRTMREFAEQEIVIPTGPFQGRRFSVERQPLASLWFHEVENPYWQRFVATGPTQSGKTLSAYVIPILFHLFEHRETVIAGLPTMEMAADKWQSDLLPAIERTRYRELIPLRGDGSRGGKVESVQFRNGATLRFMSGGGGDKKRAGYTARVLVVTEVDGMDESGASSREADKITQLERRTTAFGDQARTYLECTVSVEKGRTWQEYTAGSQSRIALPCPHCGVYVTPEREHCVGWKDAETEVDARAKTSLVCPSCGALWTEDQRIAANHRGVLVHRGQDVDASGVVHGDLPPTRTLGMRWTAANNLFMPMARVGADEWKASRAENSENADKALRQFTWALPYQPLQVDLSRVEVAGLLRRVGKHGRGVIPDNVVSLSLGCDINKRLGHWVVIAWLDEATGYVVDYGRAEFPSDELGEERGIMSGLRTVRDDVWGRFNVAQAFIDRRYQGETVDLFCLESGEKYTGAQGMSATQAGAQAFRPVKSTGSIVVQHGEGYHFVRMRGQRKRVANINVDHWKTWAHNRLLVPADQPGALFLFSVAKPTEHIAFAKHITAERKVEEFVAGKGNVTTWHQEHSNNHFLDALMLACAAGHAAGVRLAGQEAPPAPRSVPLSELMGRRR